MANIQKLVTRKEEFSVVRALQNANPYEFASCPERDVTDQHRRDTNRDFRGTFIPANAFSRSDLGEYTSSFGGVTVQTTVDPNPYGGTPIGDALIPFAVLSAAGMGVYESTMPMAFPLWQTASSPSEAAPQTSEV